MTASTFVLQCVAVCCDCSETRVPHLAMMGDDDSEYLCVAACCCVLLCFGRVFNGEDASNIHSLAHTHLLLLATTCVESNEVSIE